MQKVKHLEHADMLRTYEESGIILHSQDDVHVYITAFTKELCYCKRCIIFFLHTQESACKINCSQVMSSVKERFYKLG